MGKKCPGCGAIMMIDWYRESDDAYYYKETCTVCRVIHRATRAKNDVMGLQFQD